MLPVTLLKSLFLLYIYCYSQAKDAGMTQMATMRQRDNGNWFVEIRKKGFPTIRKTVRTKTQAKQFIYRTESLMDEGEWIDPGGFDQTITVPEVLDIYLNELLEDRPGHTIGKSKISCINWM